ncbi:methyltransferase family protein [Actinomycetota bacterium]
MIDGAEQTARLVGAAGLLAAWLVSGSHAVRTQGMPAGRGLGLAPRFGALATYLMAAIPYFLVWILLWRRLPGTPPDWFRAGALIVGGALGFSGFAVYLWGRLTLGSMYNISSVLGSELYADHQLIAAGPFRYVRHPMYFGIALAAVGALMVYRTWAMVFAVAALPAFFGQGPPRGAVVGGRVRRPMEGVHGTSSRMVAPATSPAAPPCAEGVRRKE